MVHTTFSSSNLCSYSGPFLFVNVGGSAGFKMQSVFWCVSQHVCVHVCSCMWLEVVKSVPENVVCMNL